MDLSFRMHAERTPNPNSIKWVLSQPVADERGTAYFDDSASAGFSPLAIRLLAVSGVTGVFLGPNFITVSKREEIDWTDLAQPVVEGIKAWVASEVPAIDADAPCQDTAEEDQVMTRIREILERDIRPYVAQDGGEITLAGFRDGVVQVYLQGACSGCPSSTVTLKMGIEARLKEEIPEVTSVVAL